MCGHISFTNIGWTKAEVVEAQVNDPVLSKVINLLKSHIGKPKYEVVVNMGPVVKTYWSQWEQLEMFEDVLYRKWFKESTGSVQKLVVLPRVYISDVLQLSHDSPAGGHMGVNKTLYKTRQQFYWSGMRKDVTHWIKSCKDCQARKSPIPTRRAPMVPMHAGEPLERVGIDILGPLPQTVRGSKYILVVGDYFTKWMELGTIPPSKYGSTNCCTVSGS